jgi:hypothetical protein
MHNMIVEDERDEEDDLSYDGVGENVKILTMRHLNLRSLLKITRI